MCLTSASGYRPIITPPPALGRLTFKYNYVEFNSSVVLLGRLPKVDLIILEGENVRPYVRPSVRPQKVSSISMKFGI